MTKITENTFVSLGLVVGLLGGVGYVTYVAFQGSANAKAIEDLRQGQTIQQQMSLDIAVIKSKVENIEKKLDQ